MLSRLYSCLALWRSFLFSRDQHICTCSGQRMVWNTSCGASHPWQLPLLFTLFSPYDWSERSGGDTGFLAPWGLDAEVDYLVYSDRAHVFPSQRSYLCIWYSFERSELFKAKFGRLKCSFYVCTLCRVTGQIWFGPIFADPGHSLAWFHTWLECILGREGWEVLVHFFLSSLNWCLFKILSKK
jgi:hypothetical protein